jgi:hypothetical protein
MENPNEATSFKPLTVSLTRSGLSTPDPTILTRYAAERARLLFGCYRKGDANDPDVYVAAVTATLARYPEDVIRAVTHPASGLPIQKDFLPTVAEVYRACEAEDMPRRQREARERQDAQRRAEIAERDQNRNTPEQDDYVLSGLRKLSADLSAGELPPASEGEERVA